MKSLPPAVSQQEDHITLVTKLLWFPDHGYLSACLRRA
jgi:hypothetical protein